VSVWVRKRREGGGREVGRERERADQSGAGAGERERWG
jgi:hypothetical protein